MKLTRIYYILCSLFIAALPSSSNAQAGQFKKGYVYLKNGDMIDGYIKRKSTMKLSEHIHFREAPKTPIIIYTPTEVERFEFLSDRTIYCSINPQNSINEKEFASPRFARLLVDGDVTLYKLYRTHKEKKADSKNVHWTYYIKKNNVYTHLDDPTSSNSDDYVDVLADLMSDCSAVDTIIRDGQIAFDPSLPNTSTEESKNSYNKTVGYSDEELQSLVTKYINCRHDESEYSLHRGQDKVIKSNGIEAGYHQWVEGKGPVYSLGFTRFMQLTDNGGKFAWSYGANVFYTPELNVFGNGEKSTIGALFNAHGRFYVHKNESISPFIELGVSLYLPAENTVVYFNKRIGVQAKNVSIFYSNNSTNPFGFNESIHQIGMGYMLN